MRPGGLTIRAAQPADFDAICALTNHYILNTAVHFAATPSTPHELRTAWEKSRDQYPFLIATLDSTFAGFAKAYRWRERDAYALTAETGIYVIDAAHRRGVGRTLYTALIDECRRRNFHSLIGGIALPNPASVALHERLGFTHVGTVRHAGFKLNAWHDVGFWQLML